MSLFRAQALDEASSPERLDELMHVTTPWGWLSVATTAAVFLALSLWAWFGKLPDLVQGPGVLLPGGGLRSVVSLTSAQLVDLLVKPGEWVEEGAVVARVQPADQFPNVVREDVHSPYAGKVAEIVNGPGQFVTPGEGILNLVTDAGDSLTGRLFYSLVTAKRVKPGMEVRLSPSTAQSDKYGFLLGTVLSVGEFPVPQSQLSQQLGGDELAKLMSGSDNSAPVEIRVRLDRDLSTPSGYHWTSTEGPKFKLAIGTVCTSSIVIEQRRPLDLVIPYLEHLFGGEQQQP